MSKHVVYKCPCCKSDCKKEALNGELIGSRCKNKRCRKGYLYNIKTKLYEEEREVMVSDELDPPILEETILEELKNIKIITPDNLLVKYNMNIKYKEPEIEEKLVVEEFLINQQGAALKKRRLNNG